MSRKQKIFYLIILLLFIGSALYVGYHHEPWADEAHAWLIARDTSLYTLFFKYLHTDGHPALWHLVLKVFMAFGGSYKYFFVIPVIFSSIGVTIFLFKSNFPWYIKILFPFSYFVFYQYTIVARGYCLLLPIMAAIAAIWDKRHEKCFLFTFLLILLTNTEAYTYILAGFIYVAYFYEFFTNKKIEKRKEHIISLIILTISFIVTFLYVVPIPSNTFKPIGSTYYISDSLITNYRTPFYISTILSFIIVFYLYYCYKKSDNYKNIYQFIFFVLPVILFYSLKYLNLWHLGIMTLILMFCFWIHKMARNKYVLFLLVFSFSVQTYYTISSSIYDINNVFSPAKEAADFLRKYQDNKIYGLTFNDGAINPYFDKNIYLNWDNDISFFYWNTKNKFYDNFITEEKMLDNNMEVVVNSIFSRRLDDDLLKDKYNIYEFKGYTYFQNHTFENQTIKIYVLKEIDKDVK